MWLRRMAPDVRRDQASGNALPFTMEVSPPLHDRRFEIAEEFVEYPVPAYYVSPLSPASSVLLSLHRAPNVR